jgi:hypothetical protein
MSELNLGRELLKGRDYREVPQTEVLSESARLLNDWMGGEIRIERPKLYDHYALVFTALIGRLQALEDRVAALEAAGSPARPAAAGGEDS